MSKNYEQLKPEQRYQIEALLKSGLNQKEIALILNVHPSTISRELNRNTSKRGKGALVYRAKNAQRRTDIRHAQKPKQERFNSQMKAMTREMMQWEKYSPELIEVEGKKQLGDFVSHETIYKWIWHCKQSNRKEDKNDKKLYQHLAHGRRRRKRGLRHDSRGIIPNRVSIEQRPKIVERRNRIGDIEVDLMMGKDHKGALLVMTDRSTLCTQLKLLPSKESKEVHRAMSQRLSNLNYKIKTITFDNDKAFSKHEAIAKKLNASSYFTRPYTSQDKGTVENRIGLIRRFFPKKTNLIKEQQRESEKLKS